MRLSNGIKDAGGNQLAATSWNFTTDKRPPSPNDPQSNAKNMARSGNVKVTFSESVKGVSGNQLSG